MNIHIKNAMNKVKEFVAKCPDQKKKDQAIELFELFVTEVESGESAANEYDLLLNSLEELEDEKN